MLAWVVKGKENFAGPDANAATVAHCARGGQDMRHTTKESPRSRKNQPHGSSYIPNPDGGECSRQRVIFLYFFPALRLERVWFIDRSTIHVDSLMFRFVGCWPPLPSPGAPHVPADPPHRRCVGC